MGKLRIAGDRLPLFIGAGVIKEKSDIEYLIQDNILGAFTLGSYTDQRRDNPNKYFNWDELIGKADNRIELDNCGRVEATVFLPESIKRAQAIGMQVIINVAAAETEDPLVVLPNMVEWGLEMGANAVEINGSCPNIDKAHLGLNVDATGEVFEAIRQRVGLEPAVGMKFGDMANSIIRSHAASGIDMDFITKINSIQGTSGPVIRARARHNLISWAEAIRQNDKEDKIDILSIGGIEGSMAGGLEAYDRVHHLGAFAVGVAQAAYRAPDMRQMIADMAMGYADGPDYYGG